MSDSLKIGVIGGGGWLGGAIVGSILARGTVRSDALLLSYRRQRPDRFADVFWTTDNQALCDRSDVLILAVRPADWPSLAVNAGGRLVISVMAGIGLAAISDHHKTGRVVPALPNAAAEVGK